MIEQYGNMGSHELELIINIQNKDQMSTDHSEDAFALTSRNVCSVGQKPSLHHYHLYRHPQNQKIFLYESIC